MTTTSSAIGAAPKQPKRTRHVLPATGDQDARLPDASDTKNAPLTSAKPTSRRAATRSIGSDDAAPLRLLSKTKPGAGRQKRGGQEAAAAARQSPGEDELFDTTSVARRSKGRQPGSLERIMAAQSEAIDADNAKPPKAKKKRDEASIPPSRRNKKGFVVYLSKEASTAVRRLALDKGCSAQMIGRMALNMMFAENGLPEFPVEDEPDDDAPDLAA